MSRINVVKVKAITDAKEGEAKKQSVDICII